MSTPHLPSTAAATPQGRLRALGHDAVAALVVGLSAISSCLSAATLIFQGVLAPHLPAGIGAALFGGAVLSLMAAWRATLLPLASVGSIPSTVSVLAALTAAVAASASAEAVLPTAVAAMAVAGLLVGVVWWGLGRRGWGDLIRYLPYPVIGGFLAATGWLMLVGGLGVAMGQSFTLARLAAGLPATAVAQLVVGGALGLLIWQTTLRSRHALALPVVLALGIAAIHGGLAAAGLDIAHAQATGWLLSPFGRALPVWPLSPDVLAHVQWGVVAQQVGLLASVVAVTTISLLLSDTGLEAAWEQRVDINRDLVALGQGNLLAAAGGGLIGGLSVTRSLLNQAAGARSRASGALLGVLCLCAIAWGAPVFALMPKPLLGAVLVYQGLSVMKAWLVDSRPRLNRVDHGTIVVMVAITAVFGFLPAVCVGVLACCVDFAVSSSRHAAVRRLVTRSAWPAKAERNAAQTALLQREGERFTIVELQGVLFFGSATRLQRQIEPLIEHEAQRPRRLLFDFHHVRGVDTSAAQALKQLAARARRHGVEVELSSLSPALRRALADGEPLVRDSIDAAVAAWDDAVLARAGGLAAPLEAAVAAWLPPGTAVAPLLAHFEPQALRHGECLFAQGDRSDALYLVRAGRIAIVGRGDDGHEVLLRTVHEGGAIGEMGLLRQAPRSATARAEGPAELLALRRERLEQLLHEAPELAALLFRLFVMQMAGRVEQLGLQAHTLARR